MKIEYFLELANQVIYGISRLSKGGHYASFCHFLSISFFFFLPFSSTLSPRSSTSLLSFSSIYSPLSPRHCSTFTMDAPPLTSSPVAISASSLIATLHQTFSQSQYRSLRLDSSSIIVIGPNIDEPFVQGIWDHAYRRSEDQSIIVL
jgi:hypothetical protein